MMCDDGDLEIDNEAFGRFEKRGRKGGLLPFSIAHDDSFSFSTAVLELANQSN